MNRTISRIYAMMSLYNYEQEKDISFDSVLDHAEFGEDKIFYDKEFYNSIVDTALNNLSDIDYYIAKDLDNYSIDRLNKVDLCILRVAVCEMKYLSTPPAIAINEAVNISKDYSTIDNELTYKFNNSLLDKIRKDLGL